MRMRFTALTHVAALVAAMACAAPAVAQDSPDADLLKQTFPQLHDAIWDIPTLENGAKQALVAAFTTAVEMSRTEAARTLEEAFGLSLADMLKSVDARPEYATSLALEKLGEGLVEDAVVSVSAALLTDLILAGPLFEDIPPPYKLVLGAAIRATFEEGYVIAKGLSNPALAPELIYSELVDRALDVYAIARESRAVADVQRAAFVASAQSVETAATLAMLKTTRSGEVAMQTVREAQEVLADMVGQDDVEAVRDVVTMGFIALLAQKRGDTVRAKSLADQMLANAGKADNIGMYSAILRPFDWLVAINREDFRDSPSEAAFVMVSTTSLRALYDGSPPAVAPPPPPAEPLPAEPAPVTEVPAPEPPAPAPAPAPAPVATGVWGPEIVIAADIGYSPCQDRINDASCLRALGLSEQAIAFSHVLSEDYSGFGRAVEFAELGPIDLAVAEFVGASNWYVPVLVNGSPDVQLLQPTLDLAQSFRDDTSRAMLARYPGASSRDMIVTAHRTLPDGTQRFVLVETLSDQCRACDIIGSAVTFVEIGPATGGRLQSVPVGLHITGPGALDQIGPPDYGRRPDLLQSRLNSLGYPAGAMDGYPGPATREALMAFQVEACLTPTGEPDPATVVALGAATGFSAPCVGAALPSGITANTPLRSGTYVDDPSLCQLETVPPDQVFQSEITISDGGGVMWGYEDGCVTTRTDIRNGVTLFRGTCYGGNEEFTGNWTFDLQSNESFVYASADGITPPQAFARCDDASPLVTRTAAPAPTVDDAGLRLSDGVYVTDLTLCGTLSTANSLRDVRVLSEDAVDLGIGEFCLAGQPTATGGALDYTAHCPFAEDDYIASWTWRPINDSSFIEERGLFPDSPDQPWGLAFSRCPDPGNTRTAASAILDSADHFNVFESIMAGECSGQQVCSVTGVDGTYALRALSASDLSSGQATALFQMLYEQGVAQGIPVTPAEIALRDYDRIFMLRRGECTTADCATAVMIVHASAIGNAPGASGYMGFTLEMPAGWVP